MLSLVVSAVLPAASALAQPEFEPIENRDYAIDLYQGSVLGSIRIVGMGGAAVAMAEGSSGLLANPAAPAIRPATSKGNWDWDWHIDWLNPALGSDFDNNGVKAEESLDLLSVVTFGVVLRYKQWALGGNVNRIERTIEVEDNIDLNPEFIVGRVGLAREFNDVTAGLAVRTGGLRLDRITKFGGGVETAFTLFEITGSAIEAGAVWHPGDRDVRVGAVMSFPVTSSDEVTGDRCDPLDCEGYILPGEIVLPWRLAAGIAWRLADTRWNRRIDARWRDERYVVLTTDVVIDGPVDNGHGIEAFFDKQLQRSGRDPSVSIRTGIEFEWKPGLLRVRGGSYWEPSRFDGVSGRLHVTAGMDLRIWSFCFWRERYRVRFSITADIADKYGNTGLSLGLWN